MAHLGEELRHSKAFGTETIKPLPKPFYPRALMLSCLGMRILSSGVDVYIVFGVPSTNRSNTAA